MNPITFSTLACPHWQIEAVIEKASEFGYDGIEWRGGSQGHVHPEMPGATKRLLRQRCADAGLMSLAVTAYTSFVSNSAGEGQANVEELQKYADLGAELGANYVRAFLGELPEGAHLDSSVYKKISDCLNAAAEYANSVGVNIAIEPHDDFVHSTDVAPFFNLPLSHHALRVIWDIANAFAAGEDPAIGFDVLKGHLAYVQVKDGKGRAPDWRLCQLGEGDVPLQRAVELLRANDYQGAFSVEWEYAWHLELDPPEIALPVALRSVQKLLTAVQQESR
jgi:sugar phosphate isomerase/epimerase